MDYGFAHDGIVYTPNHTPVDVSENADRNAALERTELAHWQTQPSHMRAYYHFPAEHTRDDKRYREAFAPRLHSNAGMVGTSEVAYVSTWLGTRLGEIVRARVYRHNFGSRMVSLRVRGTNGAMYTGRASYDWGTCVNLRRVK